MVQIIPGILPTTESDLARDISRYKLTSFKDSWVHFDFMDNKFVQNQGIDLSIIAKYPMPFIKEAHLMVQHPKSWIEGLGKAGFKRVFFHLEAEDSIDECISEIKKHGMEAGLALKYDTSLEKLEPFIPKIDAALLMSIVPGFQGQPFIAGVLDRIKEASRLRLASRSGSKNNDDLRIGVDGAVKSDNIKGLVSAGVDFVIVGSYLLKGDIDENLENIWEAINGS